MRLRLALIFIFILVTVQIICGQNPSPLSGNVQQSLSEVEIQKIIATFTAKEAEFREMLNHHYQFKRKVLIERIGSGGLGSQITGIYHRVSTLTFNDAGKRDVKDIFFPPPKPDDMKDMVTEEDLDDLGGIQPFALETSQIDRYRVTYVGKEHIDELDTHVFDVAPKVMPNPKKTKERYFVGRIWVEDQGFQIVKTKGKAVPETDKNKFPVFETYREQIDDKYWFPTYTYADEILEYPDSRMHVRMKVIYSDFQRFRVEVKITDINKP